MSPHLHFVAAILFLSLFLSSLYFSTSWYPPPPPAIENITSRHHLDHCQQIMDTDPADIGDLHSTACLLTSLAAFTWICWRNPRCYRSTWLGSLWTHRNIAAHMMMSSIWSPQVLTLHSSLKYQILHKLRHSAAHYKTQEVKSTSFLRPFFYFVLSEENIKYSIYMDFFSVQCSLVQCQSPGLWSLHCQIFLLGFLCSREGRWEVG